MSVYRRGKYFHYDFEYRGQQYRGTTEQLDRGDAELVEAEIKKRLRQERWGIAPPNRKSTPTITAFAEKLIEEKERRLERPDIFERTLRMVLGFWGKKPTKSSPVQGGVYKDLRLADPILEPKFIVEFDAWMTARRLSASTKNSYRSAMSQLYELALKPRWRAQTKIDKNPFEHIDRDRPNRRHVELSLEDIRAWLRHADPHIRLALAIGALAPKLRLNQVLALRFDQHLDQDLTTITFRHHKTSRFAHQPQRTAVVEDLQRILLEIRRQKPDATFVITYRGKQVRWPKRALKAAAEAAGLKWGIKTGGVTFHALRHGLATAIARFGISRLLHAAALGHKDPRTTEQFYTHLDTNDQRTVYEPMAKLLGITDMVLEDVSTPVGTRWRRRGKNKQKSAPFDMKDSGVIH